MTFTVLTPPSTPPPRSYSSWTTSLFPGTHPVLPGVGSTETSNEDRPERDREGPGGVSGRVRLGVESPDLSHAVCVSDGDGGPSHGRKPQYSVRGSVVRSRGPFFSESQKKHFPFISEFEW